MFNKLYCAAFEPARVGSRESLMLDKSLLLLTLLALAPRVSCAQSSAPDTPEPGSVEEIAQATTEARFLSPWVAYLPASAGVVSPRTFLHRIPGAAGELVNSSGRLWVLSGARGLFPARAPVHDRAFGRGP